MRRTAAWTMAVAGPALVGIGLLTAPAAMAQTDCAYVPGSCVEGNVIDKAPDRAVQSVRNDVATRPGPATLPFTGGEVTVLALMGGAAVAGGAVLLVAARRRTAPAA